MGVLQLTSNEILSAARSYVARGWSVIPVPHGSKVPAMAWKEYQKRHPTEEELIKWFGSQRNNIGIVTGAISNLVVIDLDGSDGMASGARLNLSSSMIVTTGKGRHFYYRYPSDESVVKNGVRLHPGLDIRGEGGYVLAPPSRHPDGRQYSWLSQGLGVLLDVPKLPDGGRHERGDIGQREITSGFANQKGWINEALKSLADGNRNNTFTKIVGRLHRDGWEPADIAVFLAPHADKVGFGTDELSIIVNSICAKPRGLGSGAVRLGQEELQFRSFQSDDDERDFQDRNTEWKTGVRPLLGFKKLDSMLHGLRKGEIFTVAARPGVGKTNFVVRAAKNLCRQRLRVALCSTELAYDVIWRRYRAYNSVAGEHKGEQLFVSDSVLPTVESVAKAVEKIAPQILIFDNINFLADESGDLARFMRGIKEIAREKEIPVVMVAQLNRLADSVDLKTGNKAVPRLSHIKGSGAIEEMSAQVLLMVEGATWPDRIDIMGQVDKNRYGDKGPINFVLKKNPYSFEEASDESLPSGQDGGEAGQ